MVAVATGFEIGPNAHNESKVALVRYGREVERVFGFDNNTDKATVLDAIANVEQFQKTRPGGTATPDAIEECLEIFKEQGQTGIPQIIMVFSDGVTHYAGELDAYDNLKLNEAVNKSIEAGTINFAVFFASKNQARVQMEALLIAHGNQERAIYNSSFDAIEHTAVQTLSCGKYGSALTCIVDVYTSALARFGVE